MNISIHGKDVSVKDELRDYTEKKLERLDRYLPNISDVKVDLAHQHTKRGVDLVSAQITVRHQRGAILRAEDKVNGDIKTAIDNAVDKMYRRIERFKGKTRNHKGREKLGEVLSATLEEISTAEDAPVAAVDELDYEPEVVRRKDVSIVPMTEQEAIEQMELLGHSFFLYLDADSGKMNVIYRRGAEGYGVLVPDNQ